MSFPKRKIKEFFCYIYNIHSFDSQSNVSGQELSCMLFVLHVIDSITLDIKYWLLFLGKVHVFRFRWEKCFCKYTSFWIANTQNCWNWTLWWYMSCYIKRNVSRNIDIETIFVGKKRMRRRVTDSRGKMDYVSARNGWIVFCIEFLKMLLKWALELSTFPHTVVRCDLLFPIAYSKA